MQPYQEFAAAAAGGASHWDQLARFLLTGAASGVYEAARAGKRLTGQNDWLRLCLNEDGSRVVENILGGRFPRSEPVLFALAMASSPKYAPAEVNRAALAALPLVASSAAGLAAFVSFAGEMRGWGRSLRSAVADWYKQQPAALLARQLAAAKPKMLRTHRSALRKAHPKPVTAAQNALFQWISDGQLGHLATPEICAAEMSSIDMRRRLWEAGSAREAARWIADRGAAVRSIPGSIPERWRASAEVWEALFEHLSYRALLRSLGAMTAAGFLTPRGIYTALTAARLTDRERIRASRLNPVHFASAMIGYRAGARTVEPVFDALSDAFHVSVALARETNPAQTLVAIDASGSMQGAPCRGLPKVPASLAGAVMAITFGGESGGSHYTPALAFDTKVRRLALRKSTRLTDVLNEIGANPCRTDASAPIRYALEHDLEAEAFVIVTDRIQPGAPVFEVLRHYRSVSGIEAKLVLISAASPAISGWDPMDAGAIGSAGFDTRVPAIVRHFLGGRLDL